MKLFTAILFSLASALIGRAAIYYVSTTGNNSWDGSTPAFVSGTTGPKLNFAYLNASAAEGDVFFVRGGVYDHSDDGTASSIRLVYPRVGTQANPIIISNYPGEVPIIYGSGANNNAIYLNGVSWIKIFGITVSNAYRQATVQFSDNCEIAYCTFTGRDDDQGETLGFNVYNDSQRNWIHHNLIYNGQHGYTTDSGHGISVGLFYTTTDATAFNLIESNICYWAGHDVISVYGASNVLRGNFVHNEPWYFRQDIMTNGGHRCVELGGQIGNYNVCDYNRLQYAGLNANGGSHGIEVSSGVGQIIRFNELLHNDYSGLTLYGKGFPCDSNRVYNNTITHNGWAQRYVNLYDANSNVVSTTDEINWKSAVTLANSTNNFFLNNIIWSNYDNTILNIGGTPGIQVDSSTLSSDPLFASTADGGPFSTTQPNVHLRNGSPAIDFGTWLTTITTASGSGATIAVADAGYFFAGLTAAGRVVPGDRIQVQGRPTTAVITAISANTITLGSSLTWIMGDGISMPYSGAAPDAGAYEYSYPTPRTTSGGFVSRGGRVSR